MPTPPPPPSARGGNAPARGEGMFANAGYVLPNDASVVDWLNQALGLRQLPVGSSDVRRRDTRSDPDLMDTSSGRDIVPWQFQDIPPRLVPGLLTYAEVIKRYPNVEDFAPIYTRPRPSRCLIHTSNACKQCHLCIEFASWELEQDYACRLAGIQFEGRDPADAEGDFVPSGVAIVRLTIPSSWLFPGTLPSSTS